MGKLRPDQQPLSGVSVLITRPLPQQTGLSEKITAAGGVPVAFPLLNIQPFFGSQAGAKARDQIQALDQYDFLIFVSHNAANLAGQLINKYWSQLPFDLQLIAIGRTTANTLNLVLNIQAICPSMGADSESVLALSALQDVVGKRIGIVRGQGGRELLATILTERGAVVDYIEVYSRQRVAHDQAEITKLEHCCDMITVHNGESLKILTEICAKNMSQISLLPLVVPSQRILIQARQQGFSVVNDAGGADDQSMLDALKQLALRDENEK
ncbi:MAG: uroporphyrinogen-III synthase [Gammaproteobacteria bacterium]|nr:uroporphyrinogen-III synthase [Gammaproteobacteria bacterium]